MNIKRASIYSTLEQAGDSDEAVQEFYESIFELFESIGGEGMTIRRVEGDKYRMNLNGSLDSVVQLSKHLQEYT